ncbi:MAG: phage tail sheath subtilisin-like domain-containing protein [Clostridiales Family XIII bacterium]|jgi:phage tail sheath protein FI|nr:phage tail sheath subtilisin-like domain-containing protein [Clostridiales Family XIII bacterium]
MAEYLSPGVYVEEYDSSPRPIEGVGTSTAGFVGLAVKGPAVGAPSLITSFAEYQRQFGGYLSPYTHGGYRFLPYSVEQFFINGGTRCYVSRVIPVDAKCATAKQGILSLSAANAGKWGNRITAAFVSTNKRKMQLLSAESDQIFTVKSAVGFSEGDIVEFASEYNRITSIFENTVTFEKAFASSPVDDALVPKTVIYSVEMDVILRCDAEAEVYSSVSLNPTSPDYIAKRLGSSALVTLALADKKAGAPDNPVTALFGEEQVKGTVSFAGGTDGTVESVDAGVFIGVDHGPGNRTGIESFKENSVASIIAVPGITIPEVIVSLVAHCENEKNRFAVLDVPQDLTKTDDVIKYRGIIDSTYAAVYHPWVQVYDRLAQKTSFIPPSGAVMGIYARTDVSRGVHKAPANETVSCTGLSTNYTTGEQDILNPVGVNLIRALPGQGIRVWGARTASSNSAFKYVNVRRLFIFVEESIRAATNWVVFEPNNSSLWTRVQLTISSFLDGLFRSGMLAGDDAGQAFFVDIGPGTMSQDDILNGRLICNIGIAPVRPAEFVIFRVTQFTAEAGGGE